MDLVNRYNKLMREHIELYEKYNKLKIKCKALEERELKHIEKFVEDNPHLRYLMTKSHWNLNSDSS